MKKMLALLLTAAMTVGLVACGSKPAEQPATTEPAATEDAGETEAPADTQPAEQPSGKVPKIAFVPKVEGQAWWEHVRGGVTEWATENNIDVIYKGPTSVDATEQVNIMTDMVTQGVDILCFSPNDPAACEAICKQALDQGIIVIATEASGMENITFDVEAFDEAGLGAFLMDELAKQMGEEGEYITMVGSLTMESQNNWADAAVARQKEAYPNMTLVGDRVEDDSDKAKATDKTKEAKANFPDLKGVLGTGSFDAPGAADAIKEMGLTDQMFAISVAMPSEVKGYLEEGVLKSVALWDPAISAKVMLNAAVELYNGGTIETGSNLKEEGYTNVTVDGKVIIGEGQIAVTLDNVDDFGF